MKGNSINMNQRQNRGSATQTHPHLSQLTSPSIDGTDSDRLRRCERLSFGYKIECWSSAKHY